MARGITVTGTTGSVTASGGTLGVHIAGLPNVFNITKFKAVPSAGSGPSTIELFKKDTLGSTDLMEKWKAVSGNLYDPMDNSSGTPAEGNASHFACIYEDADSTGELHIKFTNNDTVNKTYDYSVTYEEAWAFDVSRVATAQRVELLDSVLYFGGRTSSHVSLKRTGTILFTRLGDDSGYAQMYASRFLSIDGVFHFINNDASNSMLKSVTNSILARLGNDSGYAHFVCASVSIGDSGAGNVLRMGAQSTSGVLMYNNSSAQSELEVRKGDNTNTTGVKAQYFMADSGGFSYGFGSSTSSHGMLKRNGAGIDVRLGDDSNYATLTGVLAATNGATGTFTNSVTVVNGIVTAGS